MEPTQINGLPALLMRIDGEVDLVVTVRLDEGRVTGIYTVRNPEKLARVERLTAIGR